MRICDICHKGHAVGKIEYTDEYMGINPSYDLCHKCAVLMLEAVEKKGA